MEQNLEKLAKASLLTKVGVLFGLVAAITAVNYFLVVQELETKIDRQISQRGSLERELAEKTAAANNLNELLREMEQLETQLNEALTELPEGKEIDELLSQMNDIGRRSGLDIESVVPANESRDPKFASFVARIPVKMAVTGNYHEIALFMQELGNMRRIVNVGNIELGNAALRNEKVVLKSEFVATAFRFVPPDANAKSGKKVAKPKK